MGTGAPALASSSRHESAHFVLLCPPGSYADQHADALILEAERALKRIVRALQLRDDVALVPRKIILRAQEAIEDPAGTGRLLTVGSSSQPDSDTVSTVYRPDSPAVGLAEHLARVVLHRAVEGPPDGARRNGALVGSAQVQRFFIEGVARYLAHQQRSGRSWLSNPPWRDPKLGTPDSGLAAEQRCFDEAARESWRLPLYQAVTSGAGDGIDADLYAAMQEAFGGYLFERDGPREFLRFLAGARGDPNQSAEVIYGKSLELLEAEWLTGLRRGVGRKVVSLWEFIRLVWPYIRPYPWRFLECLGLIFISGILSQVSPFQFRNLIDLLGNDQAKADPWGYGLSQVLYIVGVLVGVGLVHISSVVRLVYVVNILGQNVLRDLRLAYIHRVNMLPAGYFGQMRTGDLMARFTSDMGRLADPLARTTTYSIYYIVMIVITTMSLILMSWQLTLVLLVVLPTYIALSRTLGPIIQRATRGRQERLAQINGHIQEVIFAHPIIQLFNLQHYLRRRMTPEIHEFRRVEIKADFLRAVFEEISDIADLITSRMVWTIGAVLVLASYDRTVAAVIGSTTIGTVVGFNLLMSRFLPSIHRLANSYASVAVAAASLRRVEEVLKQEPESLDVPANGTAEPPAVRHGIDIERVSFAYRTEPVLKDISVTIPAGSSTAFVGPTGAGKTTLVNMVPRFYDPDSGSVKIDGRDIREYALPALRGQMALVSQENFLFNATVRENIAMGKLGATDDEIIAAARAARIHHFIINLPSGYDTIIGERGTRLSGGQRQRVAIARALVRNAPILILDEATSALDAETEHEILEELAETTRGKTTISITHRLALAMRADTIHVMEAGEIVQSGSHDELMAKGGLYKRLFEEQNEFLLATGGNGAHLTAEPARIAEAEQK